MAQRGPKHRTLVVDNAQQTARRARTLGLHPHDCGCSAPGGRFCLENSTGVAIRVMQAP